MNEKQALLILNAVPSFTNKLIGRLLGHFKSAAEVLIKDGKALKSSGLLNDKNVEQLSKFKQDEFLKEEERQIKEDGIFVTTVLEHDYPSLLKEIPDAPVVLYVKGSLRNINKPSIGIVGSRKASVYGCHIAEEFSVRLNEFNVNVVSGMARGIDTYAHRGALKSLGLTYAVLGSGLRNVYPSENKDIFESIAKTGAVISEFPMNTQPFAYNFPRRNRIISGLSKGIIVIEAAQKSGALITADFALEQGRDVYAVPQNITSSRSQGVNNLLKQGARLITNIDEVLEDLSDELPLNRIENELKECHDLSEGENTLYQMISDRPVHIDELTAKAGSDAFSTLIKLEMKKMIKQIPGKFFIR